MADLKEIKIEPKKNNNRMDVLEEIIMIHSRKIDELEDRVKVLEDAVMNVTVANLRLSAALLSLDHAVQANHDLIGDALIFKDRKDKKNETKSNAKKKNSEPNSTCVYYAGCPGRGTNSCKRQ